MGASTGAHGSYFVTDNCACVRMGHAERSSGTIEALSLSLADVSTAQLPNVVRPILAAEVFSGSHGCRVWSSVCLLIVAKIRPSHAVGDGNEVFMGLFPTIPNVPYVPRVRLMRALGEWHRARVILMVAPAGFGKTTTAMLWLREALATAHAPRAAWVALNRMSDSAERFVEQVSEQLSPVLPGMREVLQLGRAGDLTLEQAWAAVLQEIGKCGRRVILVLDDVQEIESDAVMALVQKMLDEGPENLRLVLLSRSRPKLRFSQLQLAGAMVQLGMEDLAFGHEEFEEFVRTRWQVAEATSEMLHEIEARIRGWPAGLQLIGQALPATREATGSDLAAMTSMMDLWEYVESEILRRMPEKTQTLLVRTSQLSVISAGLCGAVLEWPAEEAERVLEEAAATNGLIVSYRSAAQVAYRVHPVLQEYLQRRLASTATTRELAQQRRRAAEWLAAHGDVDQALALLLGSGEHFERGEDAWAVDVAYATDIVERSCVRALRQMDLTLIMRWAGQLPGEAILARPRLALDVAWAGRLMERREMRALTNRAAQALATVTGLRAAEEHAMRAELYVLEAYCLFIEGRLLPAEQALQAAFALDPDPDGFTNAYAHLLNGYLNSGVKRTLEERIRSFRRAATIFEKLSFTRGCIEAHKFEALARRREGDVAGAIEAGELLIWYADAHGWTRSDAAIEGILYHGETLYFIGAVQPALACLERAAALLEGVASRVATWYQLQLRVQLCRLALGEEIAVDFLHDESAWTQLAMAKGAFVIGNDAYMRMLRDLRMDHAERCRGTLEVMGVSLAEISNVQAPNILRPMLAAEVFAHSADLRVEPLLRAFLESLRKNGVWFTVLQVHMLLVQHLQNAGREDEAAAELEGVLALFERMPCVRMVIDFPQVRSLLMRSESVTARQLLRAMQMRQESIARRPFDLSATEFRVVKLLALGHDNQRIAEELHVVTETVRFHLKNIYKKLGVHNRLEAVRTARESGLV